MGSCASPDGGVTMKEFRKLRARRSRIRVIDDPNELKRLCERPAPGDASAMGWDDAMDDLCGQEFIVYAHHGSCKTYGIMDGDFWIPFDACILVSF